MHRSCSFVFVALLALACLNAVIGGEYNCEDKKDGHYSDPDFCHIYWRCNYGVGEEYECPAGTAWDHIENRCEWLDNVDCTRAEVELNETSAEAGSGEADTLSSAESDDDDKSATTTTTTTTSTRKIKLKKKVTKAPRTTRTTTPEADESAEEANAAYYSSNESKTNDEIEIEWSSSRPKSTLSKRSSTTKSTTTTLDPSLVKKKKSLNETLEEAKAFDYHSLCGGQALFIADPFICNRYLRCNHGYAQKFKCSRSTAWDDGKRLCLWTSLVECGERVYVSNPMLLGDDDPTKTSTTTTTTTTTITTTATETDDSQEDEHDETTSSTAAEDEASSSAEPKRATWSPPKNKSPISSSISPTIPPTQTTATTTTTITTTTTTTVESTTTVTETTTEATTTTTTTAFIGKLYAGDVAIVTLPPPSTILQTIASDLSSRTSNGGDACESTGQYYAAVSSNCAGYIMCSNGKESRLTCPDRQLFNVETKQCEDFERVFCGQRPVNLVDKNQCVSKRDGIYPDLERECRVFYQCSAQLKTREAHCPGQLRFNSLTNRCDSSANIIVPCGTYYPVSAMSAATTSNTVISSTSFYLIVAYVSTMLTASVAAQMFV